MIYHAILCYTILYYTSCSATLRSQRTIPGGDPVPYSQCNDNNNILIITTFIIIIIISSSSSSSNDNIIIVIIITASPHAKRPQTGSLRVRISGGSSCDIYIYIYICVYYVYIYIYIYVEREREMCLYIIYTRISERLPMDQGGSTR